MARLHEYQGKALLAEHGITVPDGRVARSADDARAAAEAIGCPVIMKVQAWVTGRKDRGGVVFAESPDEAAQHAGKLLSMRFGNFPVDEILIEEKIDIADELFVSLTVDDAAQAPLLLLDAQGGTGIEQRAESVARIPVDVIEGINPQLVKNALAASPIDERAHGPLIEAVAGIVDLAKSCEARSLEVNPLVVTTDGAVVAADCRITIDDYAVFRHPELGIEIARELDHPATALERVAYQVEQNDHRGTFYFAQLPTDDAHSSKGLIGFHGAGGGGSMMSMDAVTNEGFTLANFCDTSGNPSAAKVYRAARIILSQPGLMGYFGSGSGVASQEQFHSAYGLAKAFLELNISIPVVVRLGGNSEDRACDILHDACKDLPGAVECYRKDDTPAKCAERFAELVEQYRSEHKIIPSPFEGEGEGGGGAAGSNVQGEQHARPTPSPPPFEGGGIAERRVPNFVGYANAYCFPITGGRVWIDHGNCDEETAKIVVANSADLLTLNEQNKPVLAVSEDEVAGADSELIGCEIECIRAGKPVVFVDLEIPGLNEAISDMQSRVLTQT